MRIEKVSPLFLLMLTLTSVASQKASAEPPTRDTKFDSGQLQGTYVGIGCEEMVQDKLSIHHHPRINPNYAKTHISVLLKDGTLAVTFLDDVSNEDLNAKFDHINEGVQKNPSESEVDRTQGGKTPVTSIERGRDESRALELHIAESHTTESYTTVNGIYKQELKNKTLVSTASRAGQAYSDRTWLLETEANGGLIFSSRHVFQEQDAPNRVDEGMKCHFSRIVQSEVKN